VKSIAAAWSRSSKRARAGLAALAAAALLGATLGPAAAGAETGAESLYGPSMRLAFSGHRVQLVGSGAVVPVRCKGPRSGSCTGTVSLHFAGVTHKAAFSVAGGHRQSVVVPLGADRDRVGTQRLRAVASTVQPLGSCRHAQRLLHLAK
jgi:hypothetical protein